MEVSFVVRLISRNGDELATSVSEKAFPDESSYLKDDFFLICQYLHTLACDAQKDFFFNRYFTSGLLVYYKE